MEWVLRRSTTLVWSMSLLSVIAEMLDASYTLRFTAHSSQWWTSRERRERLLGRQLTPRLNLLPRPSPPTRGIFSTPLLTTSSSCSLRATGTKAKCTKTWLLVMSQTQSVPFTKWSKHWKSHFPSHLSFKSTKVNFNPLTRLTWSSPTLLRPRASGKLGISFLYSNIWFIIFMWHPDCRGRLS